MSWVNDKHVQRWEGEFIEPGDDELAAYTDGYVRKPGRPRTIRPTGQACGDRRGERAGAQRHRRAKEATCRACLDSENRRLHDRKTSKAKTCADCKTPITNEATRCRTCSKTHMWAERRKA